MNMKSFLVKLFAKVFGKLKKAKVADLNNDGKIDSLNEEVKGLLWQFKSISENIDKVNRELEDIISDENIKQKSEQEKVDMIIKEHHQNKKISSDRQEKAKSSIDANRKVKDKIDDFNIL